jgi:hypothetical protein
MSFGPEDIAKMISEDPDVPTTDRARKYVVYVFYDMPPHDENFESELKTLAYSFDGADRDTGFGSIGEIVQGDITFEFTDYDNAKSFLDHVRSLNVVLAEMEPED